MKQPCFGTLETSGTTTETHYTYSTKKEILSLVTHTVISLFFLFIALSQISSALEISINSPEQVELNTSFSVSINLDSSEDYDIKISILDEANKTLSDIFVNGVWKSSFYYIKNSWPTNKEYSLRAKESAQNTLICLRARKSGATKFTEKCSSISIISLGKIIYSDLPEQLNQIDTAEVGESNSSSTSSTSSTQISEETIGALEGNTVQAPGSKIDKIALNSPAPVVQLSAYAKTRIFLACGFSVLAIFIIILLVLDKI